MQFIKRFKQNHKDLFEYLPADEIQAHDQFIAHTFLRFFPEWCTPNKISLFRVFATPVVFFMILYGHYNTGVVAFILVAFTDALDG